LAFVPAGCFFMVLGFQTARRSFSLWHQNRLGRASCYRRNQLVL